VSESQPLVTVVVPVYNAADQIPLLLSCLNAQSYPPERRQVIFVDDGSMDETLSLLKSTGSVTVYHQPNGGSYKARNKAVAHAKGEIIAFTDADCLPAVDWLTNGVNSMIRSGSDMVAGAIRLLFQRRTSLVELYDANFNLRQDVYAHRLDFGATANLFVRKSLFDFLGGFEETLRSGGDKEFGNRAVQSGAGLIYESSAIVLHPTRRSLGDLARKICRVNNGMAKISMDPGRLLPRPFLNFNSPDHIPQLKTLSIFKKLCFICLYHLIDCIRIGAYAHCAAANAMRSGRRKS
jgi:glycosyltransferase involved in cell wall biosynthesis